MCTILQREHENFVSAEFWQFLIKKLSTKFKIFFKLIFYLLFGNVLEAKKIQQTNSA